MKKFLAVLISLCMVSLLAVPVFADANSDYIAAVKAYQAQIAAKEAAYTAAVDAYAKNAKAKADADSAAILKAARRKPTQIAWLSSPLARPLRLRLTPE